MGATKEQVFAVLTEELGHHLDAKLNPKDTQGDEGEYFSALLRGDVLTDSQKTIIRTENDEGTIKVRGLVLKAEYSVTAALPSVSVNWPQDFNGGFIWINGITALVDGSSIVTGVYSGPSVTIGETTLTNINANQRNFVAKFTADGSLAWATQTIQGHSSTWAASSISSSGDGSSIIMGTLFNSSYIGNTFFQVNRRYTLQGWVVGSDVIVAKINPDGTWAWAEQIGGSGDEDYGKSVAALPDGSSIITGYTGVRDSVYFVTKINQDGSQAWSSTANGVSGGGSTTRGYGIASLADGASFVVGHFYQNTRFGAIRLTTLKPDQAKYFIAKLNPDGSYAWVAKADTMGSVSEASIAVAVDGSCLITGSFGGSSTFGRIKLNANPGSFRGDDVFIAKINPDGTWAWATQVGGIEERISKSITALADGSSIVTGHFYGTATFGKATLTSSGESDIFIVKLYSDGSIAWVTSAGGTDFDEGWGITALADGSSVFTGKFGKTLIAKLNPNGTWVSAGTTINGVNTAPTDLTLTSNGIPERSPAGTLIGTLSAADPDNGTSFTYALVASDGTNDADNQLVQIVGNEVRVKSGAFIDLQTNPVLNLNIQVTDNGASYTKAVTAAVTASVLNNVTIAVLPASVLENGANNLVYTFLRTGRITITLTVNYRIAGSADAADYTGATPGTGKTITFSANSATATLTIDPTADNRIEPDETVALSLATGTGYTIGTATAVTGTITNDDSTVTLAVSPAAVTEDGTSNLIYTLSRTSSTTNALTVNYTVAGTATLGTDYTGISSTGSIKTVSFTAGSTTTIVTVNPTPDGNAEVNETVALRLAAGTGYTVGTTTAVTGTIRNDDLPRITLAVSPASVTEDGAANLLYTFIRTGPTTSALAINYTVAGTTNLGTDYTGVIASGTTKSTSFAVGAAKTVVIVNPKADTSVEGNETVALTLAAGTGYTVGTTTAVTGTIRNDDVRSAISATLVGDQSSLLLTGTSRINGVGNSLSNTIIGNTSNNKIAGNLGKDLLTGGGPSDSDTFSYAALNESLLSGYDTITDYTGRDRLIVPSSLETTTLGTSTGNVQSLSQAAIAGLLTSSSFAANTAKAFTATGQAGTFIAMNDNRAGFQATTDAIIFLRGFSFSATNFIELL